MPHVTGTATNYLDVFYKTIAFACGYGTSGTPAYTGTGNGTITGKATTGSYGRKLSITETITITCTAAATNSGTFSVVGSITGSIGTATVGVRLTNDYIDLLISDGSTDFIVGDHWTIALTEGAMKTAGLAWEEAGLTLDGVTVLKGKGASGTDEIFVGMIPYFSAPGDWYNIQLYGYTGFSAGQNNASQPGYIVGGDLCLWDTAMNYWIIANGRCIKIIAKVSTVYESAYMGLILPYALPTEYPYPLAIGSSQSTGSTRWSSTGGTHRAFFDSTATLNLLKPNNVWLSFSNYDAGNNIVYSSNIGYRTQLTIHNLFGDGYELTALELHTSADGGNVYGALDGVYSVSGFSNASENIVTVSGTDHLVIQDTFRTGALNYAAFKLD